jgi:hypothetical protein
MSSVNLTKSMMLSIPSSFKALVTFSLSMTFSNTWVSAVLASARVNIGAGDDAVWGGMDDDGVADGAVGLTDEISIGGRFDSEANCLV